MPIPAIRLLLLLLMAFPLADARIFASDWQMVWHDEFDQNGRPNPDNWGYEHGFVRNHELQWYQPENAWCTNGLLILEARPEHKPNPGYRTTETNWATGRQWIEYTSASLVSRHKQEFKYGKFEMRARIDTRSGSWPAFWALGADRRGVGWPACGEIDIMEYYAGLIRANVCYGSRGRQVWSAETKPVDGFEPDWPRQFHIWTMEWDEARIDLLLDGQRMNHLDVAKADGADFGNPFHHPLYLILNQAIGANGGDVTHTKFPVRMEVDWVRVYQRVPRP